MDPLTHTATGLFLSRAGLNRWTPLATPILLLAANAPDVDIVSAAGGPLAYLHYHRHLTHSLIAMPVMAILPVLLVRLLARKPVRWLGAFFASLVAVVSHLLLDLTNPYGIRLWLPFSEKWLRLDITNVVDIWIWGILLVCVLGPVLSKLVSGEISSGAIRQAHPGRGFARFGLLFLLCYNAGRGVLHSRAEAILDSRIYRDTAPARIAAIPDAAAPWRWRGLVETAEFFAVCDVNLTREFDPTKATILHKPDPQPALDAARLLPDVQEFLRFSLYPFWRVSPEPEPENGKLVEVMDLRFGDPQDPAFVAAALLDSKLRVVRTSFRFGRIGPR